MAIRIERIETDQTSLPITGLRRVCSLTGGRSDFHSGYYRSNYIVWLVGIFPEIFNDQADAFRVAGIHNDYLGDVERRRNGVLTPAISRPMSRKNRTMPKTLTARGIADLF